MNTLHQLEQRRDEILKQIRSIRSMRKGTINEQFLKVPHKGKDKPVSRGPYYVLSRRQQGKTVSQRLTSLEELKQAKTDVEAYKRFVTLCKQFEELTERIGQIERESDELKQEKKRPNSQSSRTKR
jgi:uncharacterized coiled-coil DUF342 family protein